MTFGTLAHAVSDAAGRASAFFVALGVVAVWALCGPVFHYSDTWQLVINTGTTIITFLMTFLILNAQNVDTRAINLKLDELVRVNNSAHNSLIAIERGRVS